MNLAEWHNHLEAHFQKLHQERSKEGGRPVFALEHGLDDQEVSRLKEDIRAYIKSYRPNKHWLPWIVYAAELGYDYIGYEYWQTFEESTIGWLENGDRYYLRDRFKQFCKDYRGARPTGLWAQHFTIICYPITHAVLPKDFQRQLALILYETRRLFTSVVLQSPEQLGRLIAAYSTDQSDRFQRFVQNIDLVGLIAKELLSHQEHDTNRILLPSTLRRIVKDLEHERNARDWLRDARNYAARAIETRGLSNVSRTYVNPETYREQSVAAAPTIEPRLLLRRKDYTYWEVLLEVPDFTPVLTTHPSLQNYLSNVRGTVKGADPKHRFARGQLLSYGPQEVPLRTFPSPSDALLRFEGIIPHELQNLLSTEFGLDVSELMLFRVGSDGRAYQMRNPVVRPQRSYVILSTTSIAPNPLCKSIEVLCSGVTAVSLNMPEHVTREHHIQLEKLGLTVSKKIYVSPAGYAAASWDEEGRSEWLADEKPCIAIRVDHSVDSILLELDGGEGGRLNVTPQESESSVYVELPVLSVGTHHLQVASRALPTAPYEELGHLEVVIKEPRTWKPGISNQGALIVMLDPRTPSLEQLWEGRINIEVHGPEERSVSCSATFFAKDLNAPLLAVKNLFVAQLPLKANALKALISKHLTTGSIQNAAELAYACRLDFDAGELGVFSINCEREFNPLRWVMERNADSYLLSLSDDSGSEALTTITRYDFAKPDLPVPIPNENTFHKHQVPPTGGLYIARSQQKQCSIIVPREIQQVFRTPEEMLQLKFNPQFRTRERTLASLIDSLRLYDLWNGSHTTGNVFANWDKRKVLDAFLMYIFSLIDNGRTWANAEATFQTASDLRYSIEQFSRAISDMHEVRQKIVGQSRASESISPKEHVEYLAEIMRHLIQPVRQVSIQRSVGAGAGSRVLRGARWQTEFALRLASVPESLREWSGEWFEAGLSALLSNTMLARAARFLVLAVDRTQRSERRLSASLYAGWEWS